MWKTALSGVLATLCVTSISANSATPQSTLQATNQTTSQTKQLHIMLQGSSTDEIAHLVESLGGEITHRLNIIDAVGAKLPAD